MVVKDSESNRPLFHRYLDGPCIMDDVRRLLGELQVPKYNTDMFQESMDEVREEASLQSPQTGPEREQYKKGARLLLKRIEHKKRMWFRRVSLVAANAAAVVCFILGSASYIRYTDRQQITYLEASTSCGERKKIRLPDGTQSVLSSRSRACYPGCSVGEERRVESEGEGYFRVYYNEKQSFIVNTRHFDVRVSGTCFNVKSYSPDEVVPVDVESGKVQIDLPEAMVRLRTKEQILINTVSGEYNKRYEERMATVWRRGSSCFNSTSICDVTKELKRVYNCRITFIQEQELGNFISGEHDNKSLEAVLQPIGYTSGIHYKGGGDQVLLCK